MCLVLWCDACRWQLVGKAADLDDTYHVNYTKRVAVKLGQMHDVAVRSEFDYTGVVLWSGLVHEGNHDTILNFPVMHCFTVLIMHVRHVCQSMNYCLVG